MVYTLIYAQIRLSILGLIPPWTQTPTHPHKTMEESRKDSIHAAVPPVHIYSPRRTPPTSIQSTKMAHLLHNEVNDTETEILQISQQLMVFPQFLLSFDVVELKFVYRVAVLPLPESGCGECVRVSIWRQSPTPSHVQPAGPHAPLIALSKVRAIVLQTARSGPIGAHRLATWLAPCSGCGQSVSTVAG